MVLLLLLIILICGDNVRRVRIFTVNYQKIKNKHVKFLFVLGDVQIFELFEISVLERIQLLNRSSDCLYWNLQIYNLQESSTEEVQVQLVQFLSIPWKWCLPFFKINIRISFRVFWNSLLWFKSERRINLKKKSLGEKWYKSDGTFWNRRRCVMAILFTSK